MLRIEKLYNDDALHSLKENYWPGIYMDCYTSSAKLKPNQTIFVAENGES